MDFFQYMLLVCLVIGAGFILYSIKDFHGKEEDDEKAGGVMSIDDKLNAFGNSILEADEAIHELNDVTETVFKEFDNKYQELLFLYNLIDEKKTELLEIDNGIKKENGMKAKPVDYIVDDSTQKSFSNPRLKQIAELEKKGMSVTEIAKMLNMGKGEVSLILQLGKGGQRNA